MPWTSLEDAANHKIIFEAHKPAAEGGHPVEVRTLSSGVVEVPSKQYVGG